MKKRGQQAEKGKGGQEGYYKYAVGGFQKPAN